MTSELLFALVIVIFLAILVLCIMARHNRYQPKTTPYVPATKPATPSTPSPLNPSAPPPTTQSPPCDKKNRFNSAFLPINSVPQREL